MSVVVGTVGGILLLVFGLLAQNGLIVLAGSILASAALIADAIESRRDPEK